MFAIFAPAARHAALVFVTLAVLVPASVSYGCGTPQTQMLSVGDTKSDKRCNYNTIQQAIDAATCVGTTMSITSLVAYSPALNPPRWKPRTA